MKKKLGFSVLILFILILNGLILPVNGSSKFEIENNKTELKVEITYAYYLDADNDGIEDDVIVEFSTKVDTEEDLVNFDLEILLVLPSGNYFVYDYDIITENGKFDYTIFLYDTATEPGWYDIYITGTLYIGGYVEGTAYYTFDPPEAGSGEPL